MPFGVKKKLKLPRSSWAGHRCSHDSPKPTHSQLDVFLDDVYTDDQPKDTCCQRTCDNLSDHGYYQRSSIITQGIAHTKPHAHSQGLTQVIFNNCIVKVRSGHDLDQLLALSNEGPVHLFNVQTNGWIQSGPLLLPAFVLLRWMSEIVKSNSVEKV
jgi:hypothetical protein